MTNKKNRRFTLKTEETGGSCQKRYKNYFIAALLRSLESSSFLRIRKETGVTSRSSSLSMKSRACSRERILGGVRRSASSEEEVTGVGQVFRLADVQLDILGLTVLSDNHTGVNLLARSDEQSTDAPVRSTDRR